MQNDALEHDTEVKPEEEPEGVVIADQDVPLKVEY